MLFFYKLRRKIIGLLARCRGVLLLANSKVYVEKGVQLLYPETLSFEGAAFLKPYCRLASSSDNCIIMGNNVTICSFTTIETAGGNIKFGNNIVVGEYSTFQGQGGIVVEDDVLLASHVHVISNNHVYDDITKAIKYQKDLSSRILIKKNSWIGINVTIQAGVTIGEHVVIGSGSIVRSDIPDFSVAVGVPAKVVKRFDFELQKWVKV